MKTSEWKAAILTVFALSWFAAPAHAANVCNGSLDFTYPTGPNFAVPGSSDASLTTYTVNLALGAGSITGVANPVLTVNHVRFDLDCAGSPDLPCTDQGGVVEYEGDSTILSDCGVTWETNLPGGGSGTNEIIFSPKTTLTKTPNSPPCNLSFKIKVLTEEPASPAPGSDNSPFSIEEGAGYIQANNDATCNNGLSAGNQVTGSIPVCPVCTDTDCSTSACSQTTGQCVLTPKSDSGACTTDNAGNPVTAIAGACKTPGCEAGECVRAHVNKTDSTACTADNSGNPVNAIAGACKTPGCESGVCVQAHVNKTDSTPCTADNSGNAVNAVPGACKTPGCEAGVCVAQHIPVTDSTACSVDNAGNAVTPIAGACKTPGCEAGQCVQAHINKTDSTSCSADNSGNPVTALPGACKTPGCEGGVCVVQHVNKTDSTPCSVDASGNPVTPSAGCQSGCEAGVCAPAHKCAAAICRTPGFWGTHSCPENSALVSSCEKKNSDNITQQVITAGGGCFTVCGEVIKNTALANADSAVEAICVSPQGNQRLQLVRQLTSMALNCIISGLHPDCSGDPSGLGQLFTDCNATCLGTGTRSIGDCLQAVDCFNNGLGPDCSGTGPNCENQPLVNATLGLNFEPPGAAGSSNECNNARDNDCTVIPPGETSNSVTGCTAGGTKSPSTETCH